MLCVFSLCVLSSVNEAWCLLQDDIIELLLVDQNHTLSIILYCLICIKEKIKRPFGTLEPKLIRRIAYYKNYYFDSFCISAIISVSKLRRSQNIKMRNISKAKPVLRVGLCFEVNSMIIFAPQIVEKQNNVHTEIGVWSMLCILRNGSLCYITFCLVICPNITFVNIFFWFLLSFENTTHVRIFSVLPLDICM